jgi:histone H3/H4
MKNNEKLDNSLIKKNILIKEIHKKEIRISNEAFIYLNKCLNERILGTIEILAKKVAIGGKKTIDARDIKKVFERISGEENAWEV